MTTIQVRPLADDLPFGSRIRGIGLDNVNDEAIRDQVRAIFEDRGLIVFEQVEASSELHVAVGQIFGPLQEHAMRDMPRSQPGVVDLDYKDNIYEVDGKELCGWLPWHYDACYTSKLYRGGVLRAIELPPEGGLTGFADGIQLYDAISPELREKFERLEIVYHPKLMLMNQRFGNPRSFRVLSIPESAATLLEQAENAPRAVHPAIWKRSSGERVLHVSPWQAAGIYGQENVEGDALLEALCQEMYAAMTPYWHKWTKNQMIAWDNWRFLHSVSGNDPRYARRMHRTTIQGDYGLGRFENAA